MKRLICDRCGIKGNLATVYSFICTNKSVKDTNVKAEFELCSQCNYDIFYLYKRGRKEKMKARNKILVEYGSKCDSLRIKFFKDEISYDEFNSEIDKLTDEYIRILQEEEE